MDFRDRPTTTSSTLVLVSGYSFECYIHLRWRYNDDNEKEYDNNDDGEERGLIVAFT